MNPLEPTPDQHPPRHPQDDPRPASPAEKTRVTPGVERTELPPGASSGATAPAAAAPPASLPQSLQGRYRLIRNLGAGGFANVYLAYDNVLDQEVAIKSLRLGLASQNDRDRFLMEARIGAKLRHPNIATVFDIIQTGDGLQMVMEYYPGGTLTERVRAKGCLHLREAVDFARQIAQALAYAHRHNVIHRDVKPANVFLAGEGIVKLGDFGIAAHTGHHEFTQTGMIIGTPLYMAPEQGADSRDVDPRADIYALGLALYFMLTGRPPRVVDLDIIPESFRALIKQSTAHDRAQRMVSAEQFIAMLDQVQIRPLAARPVPGAGGESAEQDSFTPLTLPSAALTTQTAPVADLAPPPAVPAAAPAPPPYPGRFITTPRPEPPPRHFLTLKFLVYLPVALALIGIVWVAFYCIPGIGFYNRQHPTQASDPDPVEAGADEPEAPAVDIVLNGQHVKPGFTTTTVVGNRTLAMRVVQQPAAGPTPAATPAPAPTPAATPAPGGDPAPVETPAATAAPTPAANDPAPIEQAYTRYLATHPGISSALDLVRDQGGSSFPEAMRASALRQAEVTLLDAAAKTPADPLIRLSLGLMYARSNRPQQALQQFNSAIQLDRQSTAPLHLNPENVQAFINRQTAR